MTLPIIHDSTLSVYFDPISPRPFYSVNHSTEIENKIPSVTGLISIATLNTKPTGITNLATKVALNTNPKEIENKIPDTTGFHSVKSVRI